MLALPFESGSFDVVLSTEVIEHTADPERGIGELCRVVKVGGTLVLTSPNRLWQPVVRVATRIGLRHYAGFENFLRARRAREVVGAGGLTIERFTGFNALPLFRPAFAPLLMQLDRHLGARMPGAFVNFALLARRQT